MRHVYNKIRRQEGKMLNIWFFLTFAYLGIYPVVIFYLKQTIFQTQKFSLTTIFNPFTYIQNWRVGIPIIILLLWALLGWFLEGWLMGHFRFSQMWGYRTLIVMPISVTGLLIAFKFSEKYLGDPINWKMAFIWAIGFGIAVYGASELIKE